MLTDAGRAIGEVFPMLVGLARSGESPAVRRMAIHCLGELGPEQPETVRALIDASRESDPILRRAALTSMGKLLEAQPEVVDRLVEAAVDPTDPTLQSTAVFALGSLGVRFGLSDEAQRELRRLADTGDPSPLSAAARRALE